jgi:hypothetical protein
MWTELLKNDFAPLSSFRITYRLAGSVCDVTPCSLVDVVPRFLRNVLSLYSVYPEDGGDTFSRNGGNSLLD